MVYQKALQGAVKRALPSTAHAERRRQKKLSYGLPSNASTSPTTGPNTPHRRASEIPDPETVDWVQVNPEKQEVVLSGRWLSFGRKKDQDEHQPIRPSMRDVTPAPTMISIFQETHQCCDFVLLG